MIGKICISRLPYYDIKSNHKSFKKRPVLIIGKADDSDFVALLLSTVSREEYRHELYDVRIEPDEYPLLKLKHTSFIRTHKQTTIHKGDVDQTPICDLRICYPELFFFVLSRVEHFQKYMLDEARK